MVLTRTSPPRTSLALVMGLALMVASCNSSLSPIVCTAQFVYGLNIQVSDSITTLPLTDGISGTLQDGTFSEQMMALGSTLVGAGEREGTYSATVVAPGFSTWTASDIVVTADECHVIPVTIEARLQSP